MPGCDWIPIISQAKSLVQLVTGDTEGAKRTACNFFVECPVASQATSIVQLCQGDTEGAWETQKRCGGTISNVANGIPVVGHVKGVVHHAFGDAEGGNQALLAATRSTVVIGSGAVASIATGGLGAIPAGIAAGATFDGVHSVVSEKPQGYYAAVDQVIKNPSGESVFEACLMPVGDGLAGHAGGKMGSRYFPESKIARLEALREVKAAPLLDGDLNSGQQFSLGQELNQLTNAIDDLKVSMPDYFDPKTQQIVVRKVGGSNVLSTPVQLSIIEDKLPDKEVEARLKKEHQKAAKDTSILEKTAMVFFTTVSILLKKLDDQDPSGNNNKAKEAKFSIPWCWLEVRMPETIRFNYTCAIMVNSFYNGLLHTILRHFDQWRTQVPGVEELMSALDPIRSILDRIRLGENAYNSLHMEINRLEISQQNIIWRALSVIQLKIYKYIQDNVLNSEYLGHGVSDLGHVRVYFRVKDIKGNSQVMVIGTSKEKYAPTNGKGRPVKEIITVFFITNDKFKNIFVVK